VTLPSTEAEVQRVANRIAVVGGRRERGSVGLAIDARPAIFRVARCKTELARKQELGSLEVVGSGGGPSSRSWRSTRAVSCQRGHVRYFVPLYPRSRTCSGAMRRHARGRDRQFLRAPVLDSVNRGALTMERLLSSRGNCAKRVAISVRSRKSGGGRRYCRLKIASCGPRMQS
jgi:hypothetical protein